MNQPDELTGKIHALLFGVRRSIRYHNHRRRFFDGWRNVTNALVILSGSGTILALLQQIGDAKLLAGILAALVTTIATIDLIIDTSRSARLHVDLARRFIELEKQINAMTTPTEADLANLTNQRLAIEAEEPPVKRVLDSICHNELLRAMGYQDHFVTIRWYQRLLSQFIDIREHAITSH